MADSGSAPFESSVEAWARVQAALQACVQKHLSLLALTLDGCIAQHPRSVQVPDWAWTRFANLIPTLQWRLPGEYASSCRACTLM